MTPTLLTLATILAGAVPTDSLHQKIMCGYQGWFRCPGDAADSGWVHWSRDGRRIAPDTLTFDMWPDLTGFGDDERFAAPGFTYPDGRPAELFSSDHPATVRRHFEWMRQHDIDGVWLQHFAVDLPGGPIAQRYPSRRRVLRHVADSAAATGRVWALSIDLAGMPLDPIYDVVTAEWRRLVDEGVIAHPRYLRHDGRPVLQLWGFYHQNQHNRMTAELAERLIDFFAAPGPYQAFLVAGGDWNWRANPDPAWQRFLRRFGAYAPWNIGNYSLNPDGTKKASTHTWAADQRDCAEHGVIWLPTVYPGFSWDNLTRQPPGTSLIARRGGAFLWEQFHALGQLGVTSVYVAMFDEVDEGTAILPVTNTPPTQAHFVDYEGRPADWYLRLVGAAGRYLRAGEAVPEGMPAGP